MPGWQAVFEKANDENFVIIAAAQDSGGEAVARQWYDVAKATYVTLVDKNHTISSLYNLVNVPSAVWIDEAGKVIRIDEGAYAMKHGGEGFEYGRDDYAPMVLDWVARGADSEFTKGNAIPDLNLSDDVALAEANFRMGVYIQQAGSEDKATRYWEAAQALRTDSWNYHRQDWSFGSQEEAGQNWMKKFQSLEGKPYYRPIDGLDEQGL